MYDTRPMKDRKDDRRMTLEEVKVRKLLPPPGSAHRDRRNKRDSSVPKRDRWRQDS